MHQQSRFVVESNIKRYEQLLRSDVLDATQAPIVAELLAEARAMLGEIEPVAMGAPAAA